MQKRLSIVFLVYVFLFSVSVQAIGLSPDKQHVAFEPYGEGSIEIIVINTVSRQINASLSLSGDAAQYFTVQKSSVLLPPNKGKTLTIDYVFPYDITPPGQHQIIASVMENRPQGGGIAALIGVLSKIFVNVPFPGKYIDYEMSSDNVNLGGTVTVLFTLQNKGQDNLFHVEPYVDVYALDGDEKTLLNTYGVDASFPLAVGADEQHAVEINSTALGVGSYYLETYLLYDGEQSIRKNATITIGHEYIALVNHTETIGATGIQKFTAVLASEWNSVLEDVYITVFLKKDGVTVTPQAISQSELFGPWEQKSIPVFLDVAGLTPGKYNAFITVHYNDKTTEVTAEVLLTDKLALSTNWIIALSIALLLLADILWMFFTNRSRNRQLRHKSVDKKINKLERRFFEDK